jgi:hypothetical protein
VSWIARIAIVLIVVATFVLAVVADRSLRHRPDGQAAVVVPFIVFYGVLAILVVWILDRAIRRFAKRFVKPS